METGQAPQRVTSADFIRRFANWRMHATRRPVLVTHHGKDAHVLLSYDDFQRLDGDDADSAKAPLHRLRDAQAGTVDSLRDAVILVDGNLRVLSVNPAACDLLLVTMGQAIGAELGALMPRLAGNLLQRHVVRMVDNRERFAADIPALVRPGQWLHVDLVPAPIGGAIILRDVSEVIAAHEASDARRAIVQAIEADGAIGHARLSVRENVEAANVALTRMIGVEKSAMQRVRFSALLATGQRSAFAEAFEGVFQDGEARRLSSEMVTRDGSAIVVNLTVAEVRGAYASEGAVVVVTRRIDG